MTILVLYAVSLAIVIAIYVEVWRYNEKIERTATREAWTDLTNQQ